jgi:ABC-type uncharacterized transport system involved in gliding motility auxiliary subunit
MLKRILGLLGWLGVAVVFAAVAIRFLKPEWRQWYQGLALAGLACTLLYILSQWREIARSFSGRHARLGTLAAASVAVLLAILVVVNVLAKNHNKRWDLTAAKQFSLSEQTQKILQSIDKPLQVRVFAGRDDFERFRERLDEYQYHSKHVSVEYIDAERRPTLANQYQIAQLGTVVLEYGGQIERVTADTEQALTNGLIKVVQGRQNKVYFVQGHGERTPDDSDRGGYSTIAALLGSENFAQDKLVLAQQKEMPADATVLIVAGPKSDFLPAEIEMIKAYLGRGGKMLFLLDPPERADAPELTDVSALLKEWNIEIGNNVVINMLADYELKNDQAIDVSALATLPGSDGTFVLAAQYERHPITQGFRTVSAYRLVRSVTAAPDAPSGRVAQNLIQTTSTSWAETDLKRLMASGQVAREPGKGDKEGPISLAAAVSAPAADTPGTESDKKDDQPKPETRIAVFGDSDFATNGVLGFAGNRDVFLNTVNWLAQQENLIAIRPRDPEDRRVTLTARQQALVRLIAIFVIPGLILLAGVQTWWRRR